jgi:hypothetical protein
MIAVKAIQRPCALCAVLLAALLSTACVRATAGSGTRVTLTAGRLVTMGYILNLYEQGGQWRIAVDEIEWLTGADAAEAMAEAGLCSAGEADCQPPNGFFIRNRLESTVSYPLSKQATILMQTLSHGPDGNFNWDEEIDLERLRQIFEGDPDSHLRTVPYQITLDGGTVTGIREVYVP